MVYTVLEINRQIPFYRELCANKNSITGSCVNRHAEIEPRSRTIIFGRAIIFQFILPFLFSFCFLVFFFFDIKKT